MNVTGLSLEQFQELTREISAKLYDDNVKVHPDAHSLSGNRFVGRIHTSDSRGAGTRTSWTGRHGPIACWHAYRDVLAELFRRYPHATVRTALATYRGEDGFYEAYPSTAYKNVGSAFQPAYMDELCECD